MWGGYSSPPGPIDLKFATVTLQADKTYTIQVSMVVFPGTPPSEIPDLPNGTITITSQTLPPTPEPQPGVQHTTCQTAQALVKGSTVVKNTITCIPLDPPPPGSPSWDCDRVSELLLLHAYIRWCL